MPARGKGRPGKPRGCWGQDQVIEDLLDVARTPGGIQDDASLGNREGILQNPQVVGRMQRGMTPRQAIEDLLKNLALYGGRARMTRPQLEAVAVLLNASGFPYRNRDWQQTDSWSVRKAEVQRLLNEHSADWWKGDHPGRDKTKPKRSGESDLYAKFIAALAHIEAPASTTGALSATAPLGEVPTASWDDLIGTWAGVTTSEWLLKDRDADSEGSAPCYMIVGRKNGKLTVRWFYRHGLSIGITADLLGLAEHRRLVCVYEAFVDSAEPADRPSHRGTCLLNVTDGVVNGPYFNDRRTYGELHFDRHVSELATGYDHGRTLV